LKKLVKIKKMIGQQVNYLTIVEDIGRTSNGTIIYRCICKCGNETKANSNSLRTGNIKSCGCYAIENAKKLFTTHGMRKTRIYSIWCNMISRCCNENSPSYKRYGSRGITVCEEWIASFEKFYEDMSDGYRDDLSLEREDNNGNYNKNNCKWATKKEQARNRRSNVLVTINGRTMCVEEWSEISGINSQLIRGRLTNGWSGDKAVFTAKIK
jgi:hypothetical protein